MAVLPTVTPVGMTPPSLGGDTVTIEIKAKAIHPAQRQGLLGSRQPSRSIKGFWRRLPRHRRS